MCQLSPPEAGSCPLVMDFDRLGCGFCSDSAHFPVRIAHCPISDLFLGNTAFVRINTCVYEAHLHLEDGGSSKGLIARPLSVQCNWFSGASIFVRRKNKEHNTGRTEVALLQCLSRKWNYATIHWPCFKKLTTCACVITHLRLLSWRTCWKQFAPLNFDKYQTTNCPGISPTWF